MSHTPSHWLAAVLLWLLALTQLPATTHHFGSGSGEPPHIKVEQLFDYAPKRGYIPLRITITNRSDSPKTWTLSNRTKTSASGRYNDNADTSWREQLSVPPREMRTFEVLYPAINRNIYSSGRSFILQDGPHEHQFYIQSHNARNHYRRTDSTIFALASEQLRLKYGERIANYFENNDLHLDSGNVKLNYYPRDWRAYTGVDVLWFQQSDWEQAAAAERLPILQWVAQGGDLRILKDADVADDAVVAALPGKGTGLIPYGAGLIRVYPHLNEQELFFQLRSPAATRANSAAKEDSPEGIQAPALPERIAHIYQELQTGFWGPLFSQDHPLDVLFETVAPTSLPLISMRPSLGLAPLETLYPPPAPNALLIVFCVLIVALILGPLNLWKFRGRKRYWLLVSTPLLSLALSAIIALIILTGDGIGGSGSFSRLFLLTGDNQELVITGQASRTAFMPSRTFELTDDSWLSLPLEPDHLVNVPARTTYEIDGSSYRGSWFGSRQSQQQMLVTIRPSRSKFEIREEGGKLYVLSSFPLTCPVLYFTDASSGRCYVAKDVATGRPALLEPARYEVFQQWLADTYKQLGAATTLKTAKLTLLPNHIYAQAADDIASAPIASPAGIDWQPSVSLVIAPAVIAAHSTANHRAGNHGAGTHVASRQIGTQSPAVSPATGAAPLTPTDAKEDAL